MRILHFVCAIVFLFLFYSKELVQAKANSANKLTDVVHEFLPKNAQFIEPKASVQTEPIQLYDFDKDGEDELIVIYKENGETDKLKTMVLKKEKGQWKEFWEEIGDGFDIHLFALADVTGDRIKELLIGWMIGASAGNKLEIFQWHDHTLKKIGDSLSYHKIEFIQDEQTYLAFWNRFCCDAYTVDVFGLDGHTFVLNEQMHAKYYPKIEEFYKNKLDEMDAWFYWYALADSQIKANLLNEASLSIQKGFSFHLANKEFEKLEKILEEKKTTEN